MEYLPEAEQPSPFGACPEKTSRLRWHDHTVDALRLLATGP